jgi:hypothetical protein
VINDDDACQLHMDKITHVVNIIVGLNKNNVTYSGKIIYSDGKTVEASIFGLVPAGITGLVKTCNDQKSCVIDVYQLDAPAEYFKFLYIASLIKAVPLIAWIINRLSTILIRTPGF